MARTDHNPNVPLSVAWLPAGDYERALQLWPDFAASDTIAGPEGPRPHVQYCRRMQQKLVSLSEAGAPVLLLAPIRIVPFTAWCAELNHLADSADSRAEYAAHLTATDDPDLTVWPPGRKEPCWCGSGHKYKKCCASASVADGEPV